MSLEIAIQPGPGSDGPPLCAQVDSDAFFPEQGQPTAPAKRICAACSIRVACLRDALDRGEQYGIWGGLTIGERRKLRADPGKRRAWRAADVTAGARRRAA